LTSFNDSHPTFRTWTASFVLAPGAVDVAVTEGGVQETAIVAATSVVTLFFFVTWGNIEAEVIFGLGFL